MVGDARRELFGRGAHADKKSALSTDVLQDRFQFSGIVRMGAAVGFYFNGNPFAPAVEKEVPRPGDFPFLLRHAALSLQRSAQGEEIVEVGGGEAFDRIGRAIVDLHFARILEDHAAGEDNAAPESIEFAGPIRGQQGFRAQADDLPRLGKIQQHESREVFLRPCLAAPGFQRAVFVLVNRMKRGQPPAPGLDRGSAGARLAIGKGHVLDRQHELVVAPVGQVGGIGIPGVETLASASVNRERPFQARILAADLSGKRTMLRLSGAERLTISYASKSSVVRMPPRMPCCVSTAKQRWTFICYSLFQNEHCRIPRAAAWPRPAEVSRRPGVPRAAWCPPCAGRCICCGP